MNVHEKNMIFKPFNRKTAFTSILALMVFVPMSACDLANNHSKIDRTTNSEFQDFRDALAPREAQSSGAAGANDNDIPDLQSYVADGASGLKSLPLVSISINQSIPLREALFELAKQADYDIELDPRISGSIIFTARNKPLDEVIDRICEISGLRYQLKDNALRIEIDSPYSKTYNIDYLSFVRKTDSSMKTDVSVTSSGDAKVGGGSTLGISSSASSDFWTELDLNLKQILASNASPSYLKTNEDPQISLTSSNPVVPPVPPIDGAALSATAPQAGTEDFITSPVSIPQTAPAQATPTVPSTTIAPPPSDSALQPVADPVVSAPVDPASDVPSPQPVTGLPVVPVKPPVLKVESLPTSLSGNAANGVNDIQFTPAYSINKQAGLVSVYANERLHRQVAKYLEDLRKASTSQVLIEAKVLEVTLSDEFSTGINWNLLDRIGDFSIKGDFAKPSFSPAAIGQQITFGFAGDDITSFVSALSRFGTVHALASPRLTVLNNQSAVLNVSRNQVYFELDLTIENSGAGTATATSTTTVESNIKTVPEGVLINVLPSIDMSQRTISMQVRPTITKIEEFIPDPGVAFIAAQNNVDIESQIPVMNVQEVDSVLNMKDKQMMVMGGLLQDETESVQNGVPVASEIPLFGGLFRNQADKINKKELVIFIKATILDNPTDSIHQTDKDLYRTFSQDRRPEKL